MDIYVHKATNSYYCGALRSSVDVWGLETKVLITTLAVCAICIGEPIELGGVLINSLSGADDLALLSENKDGLQGCLDKTWDILPTMGPGYKYCKN